MTHETKSVIWSNKLKQDANQSAKMGTPMNRIKQHMIVILCGSFLTAVAITPLVFTPIKPSAELVSALLAQPSNHQVAVLIDYDYPVFMRRLWVISRNDNLIVDGRTYKKGETIFNLRISHALRSGLLWANYFSNTHASRLSSRGVFRTARTTHEWSRHGKPALDIIGQEQGLNHHAQSRRIIFHKSYWPWSDGCFTTRPSLNKKVTRLIQGGAVVLVNRSNPTDLKLDRDSTLYMKVIRKLRMHLDPSFQSTQQ